MFEDATGQQLTESDPVFILGQVREVTATTAIVRVTRQGSAVNLTFLRTEPVTYTVDGNTITGVITGDEVNADDEILIPATVGDLANGIHDIANVSLTQNGQGEVLTFWCSELRLATVDGNTITGALSNPT